MMNSRHASSLPVWAGDIGHAGTQTCQRTRRRYSARALIAWMISTSPSSQSSTTISSNRPEASNPKRNSRCGFSSSKAPPASTDRAAAFASSSLIPCLRADGRRSHVRPRSHSSPYCRRAIQALAIGARHKLSQFRVREPRRHHLRRALGPRWTPPPLLQFVDVITGLGFVSPRLYLFVGDFAPLDHPLSHGLSAQGSHTSAENDRLRRDPDIGLGTVAANARHSHQTARVSG